MQSFQSILNFMHLLKDVPKGGFIPKIQMYLEVFESLLKFVHAGTMFYFFLVTPGSCETMKFRVGMQKFLKSEGFEFWHRSCIQKKRDGSVVQAGSWKNVGLYGRILHQQGFRYEEAV